MDTYVVQKKIVTIHSEDRDVTKWVSPAQFEIDLPVDFKNVVSMRLEEIDLPLPLYVFSSDDQNVKLTVVIASVVYQVQIKEGNYSEVEIARELTGKLNDVTSTAFEVVYDVVARKLIFTNAVPFELYFNKAESYANCGQPYYENYSKWGLGSYLGFDKKIYSSQLSDVLLYAQNKTILGTYVVAAPHILDVKGDGNVYLELATYNNIDELMPYTERSTDLYYGKHGGKHNSSFAKIPMIQRSNTFDFLTNIFFSEPPIERVQKLRFKLRYHDGRQVHFHGLNYNFSIEITTLRNEPSKKQHINKNNYVLS